MIVIAGPPYGDLLTKTELAWADFVLAGIAELGAAVPDYLTRGKDGQALPVQRGVSDEKLTRPLFICFAERDEAEGNGATHWLVTANVQLQSFITDGAAKHRARVAWFEDLWQGLDKPAVPADGAISLAATGQGFRRLAGALTNHAKQFHCDGVYPEGAHQTTINGDDGEFWVWTRGFRMSVQWVNGME